MVNKGGGFSLVPMERMDLMGLLLLSVIVVNLARAADMFQSLAGPIKALVDKSCTSAFLLESSISSDYKVVLDCYTST